MGLPLAWSAPVMAGGSSGGQPGALPSADLRRRLDVLRVISCRCHLVPPRKSGSRFAAIQAVATPGEPAGGLRLPAPLPTPSPTGCSPGAADA